MSGIRYLDFQYGSAPQWRYVMGPPDSRDFRWPPVGTDRVEMRVDPREGGYYSPLVMTGDWCIFRLLDQSRREGGGTFAWSFPSSSGSAATLTARLSLSGGDQSFILDGHFTMFKCPESVCRR
jgi:type VI protein secretion system component VasK